jgi:general secretion pathway protein C
MRLALDPRAQRLLRRVPRTNVYTVAELALLSLLAIQCARLFWILATPLGPVGEWKPPSALAGSAPAGMLGSFDPFFRLSPAAGPVVVTSLDLKLFGVRQDQASGRGSAIIQTPDGQQRSFEVGDEIAPGVALTAVGPDNVTITRDGKAEQLFMDQSQGAPGAAAGQPGPATEPSAPNQAVTSAPKAFEPTRLASELGLQPRVAGDKITGVVLRPEGAGSAFRAAGLQPGDVLLRIGGERIDSPDELGGLRERLAAPGTVAIQVERGGRVHTLQLRNGK